MITKRIVITGAPGSGKSTLLQELGRLGCLVMPESYRWLRTLQAIENSQALFHRPLDDEEFLVHIGLQKFLDVEEALDVPFCFYDRSIIDVIAYCQAYNQKSRALFASNIAVRAAKSIACAILLPPPINVKKDILRVEDPEEASRIHKIIQATYEGFGVNTMALRRKTTIRLANDVIAIAIALSNQPS